MFIPQRKRNSPGLGGVNSTVVVWKAGSGTSIPNCSNTTRSEHSAVSSR